MKNFILLTIACMALSGCASIMNPKTQQVNIVTPNESSRVYIDNRLIGQGKTIQASVERDLLCKQVRIESDSTFPRYESFLQVKKSPLYILSVVPFGVLVLPVVGDAFPKAFNYPDTISVEQGMPMFKRGANSKYLMLDEFTINVKSGDLQFDFLKNKYYHSKKIDKSKTIAKNPFDITENKIAWLKSMRQILRETGFTDTVRTGLRDPFYTLHISAKLKSVNATVVVQDFVNASLRPGFFVATATMYWEIRDSYGEVLHSKTIESSSGEYAADQNWATHPLPTARRAIYDAISNGMVTFISEITEADFLALEPAEKLEPKSPVKITQTNKATSIEEVTKACVTVKINKGHGSGFFVGDAGEIITNCHVVGDRKYVEVILNDGTRLLGDVVSVDKRNDLALVKVVNSGHFVIGLGNIAAKPGDVIYSVGTPSKLQLTQSVTKGTVSGEIQIDGLRMIQVDTRINTETSGGPLVNTQGELIGILNSIPTGIGIEKIGFAVPLETAIQVLNVVVE